MTTPEKSLKERIDRYEVTDDFDRNQTRLAVLLLSQNSREGMELYQYAQEKGIV